MAKVHEGDKEIDATFSVEAVGDQTFAIVFESRGGKIGTPTGRNTQYGKGLEILLGRLGKVGAVIESIALAPTPSRGRSQKLTPLLSPSRFPLAMRNVVSRDLRMELGRAQRVTNQRPKAAGGAGTKRIRIECRVEGFVSRDVARLKNALAVGSAFQSPEIREASEAVATTALNQTPLTEEDARKRVIREMNERSGQGPFRQALLRESEVCAFTRTPVKEALEAAHIKPYRGVHTNDPNNGLLLRADVHTLFDRGLLRIDPANGRIQINAALENSVYKELDGKLVCNWQRLRKDALKWRWANPDLMAWARPRPTA